MAGVLIGLMRYDLVPTHRLKFYLIAYGVYRFLTEYIRHEPTGAVGLTFYQWISVGMIAGMVLQWMYDASQQSTARDAEL